jgi:hypothetical protein
MNRENHTSAPMGILYALLLTAVSGCIGVEGGGYVGGGYVDTYVPAPDVYVFGGYEHHHYDRDWGRRGAESRRGVEHWGGREHH